MFTTRGLPEPNASRLATRVASVMRRRLRRFVRSPTAAGLAWLVALLALLELLVGMGWIARWVIAPPSGIYEATIELFSDGVLTDSLALTLALVGVTMAIAIGVGITAGFLLFRFRDFGIAYEPWLGALFASPLPLAYPIFLVLFGRSYTTIVTMALAYATIPIIINTREGLMAVSPVLVNVGRSFNVSSRTMFWKIMFPAAIPTIFAGIRLGLIYGLLAIVAIEFLTDLGGMGRLVSDLNFRFKVPETYSAITLIVLLSALFFVGLARVERWLRYH